MKDETFLIGKEGVHMEVTEHQFISRWEPLGFVKVVIPEEPAKKGGK